MVNIASRRPQESRTAESLDAFVKCEFQVFLAVNNWFRDYKPEMFAIRAPVNVKFAVD